MIKSAEDLMVKYLKVLIFVQVSL